MSVVFHAAAYKLVHLVEANALEAIENNVFGTLSLVSASEESGVKKFVLISSDKAVRPTNVMGASKRLCELLVQAKSSEDNRCKSPNYSIVRFGNVLGSSGSVVPLFKEQISQGGPVTITHPEITRYFMTLQEAAQLVLQAATLAKGGDLFVLDMGTPVLIYKLAEAMIKSQNLTIKDSYNPDGDIEIQYVGLRPGEKMFEEIIIGHNHERTSHSRIIRVYEDKLSWNSCEKMLMKLKRAIHEGDEETVYAVLIKYVQGYARGQN